VISGKPRRGKGLVVAIDGPSGAGKSTITKLLSERIGYTHIDTGAMFRAVALAVKRAGVSIDDGEALARACRSIDISFVRDTVPCRVICNGEDISEAIRTPEISMLTSRISNKKPVRETLLSQQREMGRDGGVILEGRDIGTVVFPDAEVKFFLTASAEERGKRRYLELRDRGEAVTLEQTVADVRQRDDQDSRREHAPLRRAKDAIEIDTTGLSIDEALEIMEDKIKERLTSEKG
jgi:cytidylate kinase